MHMSMTQEIQMTVNWATDRSQEIICRWRRSLCLWYMKADLIIPMTVNWTTDIEHTIEEIVLFCRIKLEVDTSASKMTSCTLVPNKGFTGIKLFIYICLYVCIRPQMSMYIYIYLYTYKHVRVNVYVYMYV